MNPGYWQVLLTENFFAIGLDPANWGNWQDKVAAWAAAYDTSSGFQVVSTCLLSVGTLLGQQGRAYAYLQALDTGNTNAPAFPAAGQGCSVQSVSAVNQITDCPSAQATLANPNTPPASTNGLCADVANSTGVDLCADLEKVGLGLALVVIVLLVGFVVIETKTLKGLFA